MNIAGKAIELVKWTIGGALLTGLVACGGGGGPVTVAPTAIAAADTTAAVTAATVGALAPAAGAAPTAYLFNSGFSGVDANGAALNLGGATTVAITSAGTAAAGATPATPPAFAITNGGGTATGAVTFGSCIFTVKTSNIPTLPVGTVMKIDPCTLTVNTSGLTANGASTTASGSWLLGSARSIQTATPVTISSTGSVTINGTPLGTVTVTAVTGAGG